uniref:BLM10_mid domain-containing protein n=1 Tax=Syphacia muris TaxID=451379 RepID=A0A0N5AAD1_9BILA
MLLESFVVLDSALSKKSTSSKVEEVRYSNASEDYGVFFMDEDNSLSYEKKLLEEEELEKKLDYSMFYMLSFIARAHSQEIPTCSDALLTPMDCNPVAQSDMYLLFRSAFEKNVLSAAGLKCVPFLMFYFLSLDKKYLKNFVEWLWNFIVIPSKSPSDWKKAHAAACYLGNLFSVAKFVDISFCCKWMEKFVNWCTRYVNETIGGSAGASAGTLRHGTFYAVCQALLVTFVHRYSEIVANNELEKVRQWSLGHIIHCPLQPLRYMNPVVASDFASISRFGSLQLVYCSHILPQVYDNVNMPFEPFFPFESYFLKRSSSFITNLILRFQPLPEDAGEVRWERNGTPSDLMSFKDAGSLEFLEDLRRDKDIENEEKRIWPIINSQRFDYSLSKLTSPSRAAVFLTSSSLMDAT